MREKEKAFSDIVKRYKNTVFTVCYLFSKDQEEANDLFQEVLINLWRGFDSFQNKCDIKTWIWRVSFNTCISFDRKKKRSVETVPLNMTVTEYAQKIRKALRTYKIANKFMWILSILLILAFGTYVLVSHSSSLGQALVVFIVCSYIAIFMWVCYFISNVCVSPDVELMLEQVLDDLDKDKQCAL